MTDDRTLTPSEREQVRAAQRMLTRGAFASALTNAAKAQEEMEGWSRQAIAALQAGWQRFLAALAQVDWEAVAGLLIEYHELVPSNLAGRTVLAACLDETSQVPLAWVVPAELAATLLDDCDSDEERVRMALANQDEILDQCDEVLSGLSFPAADVAQESVDCLRAGFIGPAQSHAANIMDSVIVAVSAPASASKARRDAIDRGGADLPNEDEISVRVVVDRLVLGPLVMAYEQWYPQADSRLPAGFARHVTAHALHLDGVISPANALIAVMLACSLTVHYRRELAPASLALGPSGQS